MRFDLKMIALCGASAALMACGDAPSKSGDNPTSGGTYGFSNPTDDLPAPQNPGSGSGGGGDFQTSVPGNKVVESLTDQEREQICSDAFESYSSAEMKESSCLLSGVIQASFSQSEEGNFQQLCQQGYDECISDGDQVDFNCELPRENCPATVSDFVACYSAYLSILGSAKSCMDSTEADGAQLLQTLDSEPEACARLEQICPSLNDDDVSEPEPEPRPDPGPEPVPANNGEGF